MNINKENRTIEFPDLSPAAGVLGCRCEEHEEEWKIPVPMHIKLCSSCCGYYPQI